MKNNKFTLSLLMILLGFITMISSCKEDVVLLKPVVETLDVISVAADSAISGGLVVSDGGSDVVARGVCWSKAPNPTIEDSLTIDAAGTGEYSSILTGLEPTTNYYLRAYATNGGGTSYGIQTSFTTTNGVTDVVTLSASLVSVKTATCNALIADDGGSDVNERGFCWSTSVDPTISLPTKSNDGSGKGNFSHVLINLLPSTKYYVRAYATNNVGTYYGANISFTTQSLFNTVEDLDGNLYKTVTIGSQVWMSENLKTTKYNDGSSIPNLTDETQWISTIEGAYCDYDNNVLNSNEYGRLYNWYSVSDARKLCPEGWKVPSDNEWQTLVDFLGGEYYAGGKLKETGTSHWLTPNTGATNVYGFTALPAGHRDGAALYRRLGDLAIWWTATEEFSLVYSWRRSLEYNTENILKNRNFKTLGFSVRCIKE